MTIQNIFFSGFASHDAALFIVRFSVGLFFAISGYNKLFNAGRHASLTANLQRNGIPFVPFMCYWVPFWEFTSGAMMAIGFLSIFNASVLMIICIVAALCEAPKRVAAYAPINAGDKVADYLYLQEILYMILLAVTILAGSGRYSVDSVVFN